LEESWKRSSSDWYPIIFGMVALAVALVAVYGPPSEDEMRRTLFYSNGRGAATVMGMEDLLVKSYTTCTEAVAYFFDGGGTGSADWARPKSDADKEAFLLGCKEQLLVDYDKKP
jgi:hypothetical protein